MVVRVVQVRSSMGSVSGGENVLEGVKLNWGESDSPPDSNNKRIRIIVE